MSKTLTTTQHSALGDLDRFGELIAPAYKMKVSRGTRYGFSRITLQALVDQGYAEWYVAPNGLRESRIVKSGQSEVINARRQRRERVAQAALYVTTRFYPPLPPIYGEVAVTALEEYEAHGADGIVNLPNDLNPYPRGTYLDDDGDPACPVLTVIEALRIGHMIYDFEEVDW